MHIVCLDEALAQRVSLHKTFAPPEFLSLTARPKSLSALHYLSTNYASTHSSQHAGVEKNAYQNIWPRIDVEQLGIGAVCVTI